MAIPEGQDLCEGCQKIADRTPQLARAATAYGGFLCLECLVGYLFERLENHVAESSIHGDHGERR